MAIVADRLSLLRLLPPARTSLIAALVTVQTAGALVPAFTAVTMALLVDHLLDSGVAMAATAWLPLVGFGCAIFLGYAAAEIASPLNYLAVQRIDGARRAELTRLAAASPTIDVLERPEVQELVRAARADPDTWVETTPGQGATVQLCLLVRYLGVMASCLVLARYALWLVPLVVGPALVARAVWRRQILEHIRLQHSRVSEGLRADHWKRLATESTGGKEVRTFGLGAWAVERARRHMLVMCQPRWEMQSRTLREQWKIAVIIGPSLIAAYTLVAVGTVHGHSTVAVETAVLAAAWSLLQSLGTSDVFDIEGSLPGIKAFERLRQELAPTPGAEAEADQPLASEAGTLALAYERPPVVRFEQVGFRYPGAQRPVLHRLDLVIRPSELLAIVGLNGAGKSTLIKLLSGLYAPTSGRITADDADIVSIGITEWRRHLSIVFQDFVRYELSATDNIALGHASSPFSLQRVVDAARDAGFTEIIDRLPNGWDTPLSRFRNGGVDLSGGQWQQVALARALYAVRSGARLLVLDEPTAHLDVRTEFGVFQRLAQHRDRTSVVLISHRLSTVRKADRIVMLADGRITESGTHDELMAREGAYARMFAIQASRFSQGFDDRIEEPEEGLT